MVGGNGLEVGSVSPLSFLLLLSGFLCGALLVGVVVLRSALLLHMALLVGLLSGMLLVAERLLGRLERGERVGLESRWSSLTGESAWQLSPATTYLLLLLVLLGLLLAEGGVLSAQLTAEAATLTAAPGAP